MELTAERTVTYSMEGTMPYLWVTHGDFDAVDEALATDPSVDRIVETNEFDGEKYYHLKWADAVQERVNAYVDEKAAIIEAQASAEGWELCLQFVSRDQFDAFQDRLAERSHPFQLIDFIDLGEIHPVIEELPLQQSDALVAMLKAGGFEDPRETVIRK